MLARSAVTRATTGGGDDRRGGDRHAGEHTGPWTEQDYLALPESLSRTGGAGGSSPSRPGIDRITRPAAYSKAGIPFYLLIESEDGAIIATSYALTPARVYAEAARSDAQGVLRLRQLFLCSIDLADTRRPVERHA